MYGVDINPLSIIICRLRLWVELLKNAYYTQESSFCEMQTLPNLEYKVIQGNSLIPMYEGEPIFIDWRKKALFDN